VRLKLLVVEDETRMVELLRKGLAEEGHTVVCAGDGKEGLDLARNYEFDAIILDIMLPNLNGYDLAHQLRKEKVATPVLMLTAKDSVPDLVRGLDSGADDYLTKPFDLGELIARAKALIRRGKGVADPILRLSDLQVNTVEQSVRRAGKLVDLSPTEYRILEYLIHRPRVIVSKRELLEHLYDYNWEHHSNVIEAHISNLRRKLEAATQQPSIETLRGRGYRLLMGFEDSR
jgi:DNA-binding response OmpR family regulator